MNSKWIEVPSPTVPAAEVAKRALALRLQGVEQTLPLAAHRADEDIEYVHQLRVRCRRAEAALRAFRPLMGGKSKSLRRWLRRIRQAAGPARDADVLLERFRQEVPTDSNLEALIARLQLQREMAQEMLNAVEKKAHAGKWKKGVAECLGQFEKPDRPLRDISFAQFGQTALKSASRKVFQLAELHQPTTPQLHQLRIAGKRLRYSIELFHGVFPKELRNEVYPFVEKLQDRLGGLNDHATAQALFQSWLVDLPPGGQAAYLAQRISEEYECALQIREEFLHWWTPRRIAKLESRLHASLDFAG